MKIGIDLKGTLTSILRGKMITFINNTVFHTNHHKSNHFPADNRFGNALLYYQNRKEVLTMSGKAIMRTSFIDKQIAEIDKAIMLYYSEIERLVNDKNKLTSEKYVIEISDGLECLEAMRGVAQ